MMRAYLSMVSVLQQTQYTHPVPPCSRCTACKTMTEGGSQQFALYLCTTAQSSTETAAFQFIILTLSVDLLNKEVMVHTTYQQLSSLPFCFFVFFENAHRCVYAHKSYKNSLMTAETKQGGKIKLNQIKMYKRGPKAAAAVFLHPFHSAFYVRIHTTVG